MCSSIMLATPICARSRIRRSPKFRSQIETNLFGVIIMTKAVLPYFRERRAGHIIRVTSIASRIGPTGRAPYAAAKFGVECFSESCPKRSDRSSNIFIGASMNRLWQPESGSDRSHRVTSTTTRYRATRIVSAYSAFGLLGCGGKLYVAVARNIT